MPLHKEQHWLQQKKDSEVKTQMEEIQEDIDKLREELDKKESMNEVFIKNLGEDVTDGDLEDHFQKVGQIVHCELLPNGTGTGSIIFGDPETAKRAITEFNYTEFRGRTIVVEQVSTFTEQEKGLELHVDNLDPMIDDEILLTEFSKFGTVLSARVIKDERGQSKGLGLVCFLSYKEGENAGIGMNAKILRSKPIIVSDSAKRNEKTKKGKDKEAEKTHVITQPPQQDLQQPIPNGCCHTHTRVIIVIRNDSTSGEDGIGYGSLTGTADPKSMDE